MLKIEIVPEVLAKFKEVLEEERKPTTTPSFAFAKPKSAAGEKATWSSG